MLLSRLCPLINLLLSPSAGTSNGRLSLSPIASSLGCRLPPKRPKTDELLLLVEKEGIAGPNQPSLLPAGATCSVGAVRLRSRLACPRPFCLRLLPRFNVKLERHWIGGGTQCRGNLGVEFRPPLHSTSCACENTSPNDLTTPVYLEARSNGS